MHILEQLRIEYIAIGKEYGRTHGVSRMIFIKLESILLNITDNINYIITNFEYIVPIISRVTTSTLRLILDKVHEISTLFKAIFLVRIERGLRCCFPENFFYLVNLLILLIITIEIRFIVIIYVFYIVFLKQWG